MYITHPIPSQAKLIDGREYAATIVGSDPATDVAILRLNAVGGVPVVPIGDSSNLRVGQVVKTHICCTKTKVRSPRRLHCTESLVQGSVERWIKCARLATVSLILP